jgi:intraflagellar transport protein 172
MLELKKQLEQAEDVLIAHNKVDEAISMYEDLLLFNEALEVAERKNHPDAEDKRKKFYQYLIESKQGEAAAAMKETEGEFVQVRRFTAAHYLPPAY